MLNRAALICRYKQPFVDWINAADPDPSRAASLDEVNQEHTVYLIEAEEEHELAAWLTLNHQMLFERELEGWYTDSTFWPEDRSLDALQAWCTIELHTIVIDTGLSELEDDGS